MLSIYVEICVWGKTAVRFVTTLDWVILDSQEDVQNLAEVQRFHSLSIN
jgi:hypothetical protein